MSRILEGPTELERSPVSAAPGPGTEQRALLPTVKPLVWQATGQADSVAQSPLPSAPNDQEKYAFAKRNQLPVAAFSLVSMTGLLISQIHFATQSPQLWWFAPFILITLIYYLVALAVAFPLTRDFDLAGHKRLVGAWKPKRYPSIDVLLPVCGEPVEVIRNAWRHIRLLTYPGQVTFYCLDDGGELELARLCRELGFIYLSRPDRGVMKKAGNLKYGFERSSGDLILIFDADFCPRSDMLLETVPYLDNYPRLGILQTPQHFRTLPVQSWIERGAGSVQEWFYRAVQVSRNNHDGSICVGTNAIYRRAALESIGGPTQIGHSEDVHTGFDVRQAGWDLQYIPVIFAIGICPGQLSSFLAQQYRWCMGSMSLLGSNKFWTARLKFRQRLAYLSGFTYYVYTALSAFILPLVPIALLLAFPEIVRLENYVFLAPSLLYSGVVLRVWHKQPYGLDAWATKMIYGWAHAFAIADILRRRAKGWQPTGARSHTSALTSQFRAGIVVWGAGTASVWIVAAAWHVASRSWIDFTPILLSGVVYGQLVWKCVLVTLLPAADRRLLRGFSQAHCQLPISVGRQHDRVAEVEVEHRRRGIWLARMSRAALQRVPVADGRAFCFDNPRLPALHATDPRRGQSDLPDALVGAGRRRHQARRR